MAENADISNQTQPARIGIQGVAGSFSEEASQEFCRRHGLAQDHFIYVTTSAKVMESLERDDVDYGVMAIENAQGGMVLESVVALAEYRCNIVEMFHIQVEQCMLVKAGLRLGDVTEIHSHRQALRQCSNYLADNFRLRPLIEADDTAHAAQLLSEDGLPGTAAVIGSRRCADLYGLDILADNIQDLEDNRTMFLGLSMPGAES